MVDGDRIFLGWNEGGVTTSHPFALEDDHLKYLASADLVHSSVYSAAEPQLPAVRSTGTLVSFDYSSEPERRTDSYLMQTAPYVDLALLSCGNMTVAAVENDLRRVHAAGVALAVGGTRGQLGAMMYDGERFLTQAAAPTDPRRFADTMGCGGCLPGGTRSQPAWLRLEPGVPAAGRRFAESPGSWGGVGRGSVLCGGRLRIRQAVEVAAGQSR